MVCNDSAWNFNFSSRWQIAGGGLQEEERLFGWCVIEFPRVSSIIPANGYNLACTVQFLSLKLKALTSTFLPVLTNVDAMGVPASRISLQTMSYYISNALHK